MPVTGESIDVDALLWLTVVHKIEESGMRHIHCVDFSNAGEVLDFLCGIQELSCSFDGVSGIEDVMTIFASHGYEPCSDARYDGIQAVPHWIITDALASLQHNGFIHPHIHQHVRWWKEKQTHVP